MLLTSARVVPHIARARLLSSFGAIVTWPSATVAVTSLVSATLNAPSRPLAVSVSPESSTCTPDGIATGFLPIRDIAYLVFPGLRIPGTALHHRPWRRGPRCPT